MFDKRFGYIHSCTTNLGTGMRASVHIDLPGWAKEGQPALRVRCKELSLLPRQADNELGLSSNTLFDIANKHRLGWSEVQTIQILIDGINTIYEEDLELQKKHGIKT